MESSSRCLLRAASLKLTPLRLANVPPPMAFHTLALEHKAIDVAVSETGNRVAVLSNHDIALYALDLSKRPIPKPVLVWNSNVIKTRYPRHVTFVGDERLFCMTDNWDEEESCLWRSEGPELLPIGPIIHTTGASSLLSDADFMALYVQFQDGSLHNVDTHAESTDLPPQTSLVHKFPSLVPEVKVVTVEGQVRATILEARARLTSADFGLWIDQERCSLCQWANLGPQLHFVCRYICAPHFHNYTTSSQVRPLSWG